MAGAAHNCAEFLRRRKGCQVWGGLFAQLLILQFQPYHEFKVTLSSGLEVGWDKGQEMGVRGIAQILRSLLTLAGA